MMMNSIPIDLLLEIFLRLPAKSVTNCLCVSKQWESILCRPNFNELFLTRSLTRPRLLFAIREPQKGEWRFFSSPQPQDPYEKSSLVVSADSHIKLPKKMSLPFFSQASGLICSICVRNSKEFEHIGRVNVICNPSTGQYAFLPKLMTNIYQYSFLGFDPLNKIFKVLSVAYSSDEVDYDIITLGTGKMRWRKIQCPFNHKPYSEGICINGVLYYSTQRTDEQTSVIVCFDVRSEKFKFINFENYHMKLINYKGKLGGVCVYVNGTGTGSQTLTLRMWLLEDVEKEEFSTYENSLQCDTILHVTVAVAGVTATGEIVLSMRFTHTHKPFYVLYVNPERNTLQSVEIQGFGAMFDISSNSEVYAFADHVEDLKFNVMKTRYAATSICQLDHKPKPTSKSTSSKPQMQQDRGSFNSVNKFDAVSFR